jgi:hypothetical protein
MKKIVSVIAAITPTTTLISFITATTILPSVRDAQAQQPQTVVDHLKFASAFATSGNSIYVIWWSNKTTHSDIMFRASTDNGKTFGDKINLSNTPSGQPYHPAIAASGNSVFVSGRNNIIKICQTTQRL